MVRSARTRTSWERLTWWFAAAWLPFLVFPLSHVFTTHHSMFEQVSAGIIVVLYTGLYLWAFHRYNVWRHSLADLKQRIVVLAGLVALLLVAFAVIDDHMLGLLPFAVAWAAFGMPGAWRWGVGATALAVLAQQAAREPGSFESMLWLMVIVVAVMLTGFLTGHLVTRSDQVRELEHAHVVVAERDRFARDLHDLLGHSLTVVGLKVQLAERLIDVNPGQARVELAEASRAIKEALLDVRQTVEGVRATSFTDSVNRATDVLEDADLEVTVVGEIDAVTGRVAIPLGWVVQELATNVLRHSHASRVLIDVDEGRFAFEDNGIGLAERGDPSAGHGMRGIRERLSAAGATVKVTSPASGGTRTEVTW